jgi:hypothetical protein
MNTASANQQAHHLSRGFYPPEITCIHSIDLLTIKRTQSVRHGILLHLTSTLILRKHSTADVELLTKLYTVYIVLVPLEETKITSIG